MASVIFRLSLLIFFVISAPVALRAGEKQAPAATSIIVSTLHDSAGSIRMEEPSNITARGASDDEPAFVNSIKLLFTSVRADRQSDIYAYDFSTGETARLTKTKTNEYTPLAFPAGGYFSAVCDEPDSGRRLWLVSFKGKRSADLTPNIRNILTATWLNDAAFGLVESEKGNSNTLRIGEMDRPTNVVIGSAVGRCIAKVPGHPGLSFIRKENDTMKVVVYGLDDKAYHPLIPVLPGSVDFAWGPGKRIFMGSGSKLYTAMLPHDTQWTLVADLAPYGYGNITRIAVNVKGNRIAMVAVNENGKRKTENGKRKMGKGK